MIGHPTRCGVGRLECVQTQRRAAVHRAARRELSGVVNKIAIGRSEEVGVQTHNRRSSRKGEDRPDIRAKHFSVAALLGVLAVRTVGSPHQVGESCRKSSADRRDRRRAVFVDQHRQTGRGRRSGQWARSSLPPQAPARRAHRDRLPAHRAARPWRSRCCHRHSTRRSCSR